MNTEKRRAGPCKISKSFQQPASSAMRSPPPPYSGRPGRLRFWEMESFFKCPVVGMGLTLSEQKQALKKAGVSPRGKKHGRWTGPAAPGAGSRSIAKNTKA